MLLKKHRPGLAITHDRHRADRPGAGAQARPGSRVLLERHDQLCQEYLALDYSHIEHDMAGKLNLFPNDWERIRPLLG